MSDVESQPEPQADGTARSSRGETVAAPALAQHAVPRPSTSSRRASGRGLIERSTIRVGAYAWAVIGVVAVLIVLMRVVGQLLLLVIPLVIALFPAAILTPLADRMKVRGLKDALVAALLVLGTLALIVGTFTVLVPVVSDQIDNIGEQVTRGIEDLRKFLARGPFGLAPIDLNDLIAQARQRVQSADVFSSGAVGNVAGQAGRFLTGLLLFIIALFFYLKDGPEMAAWLRRQFPSAARDDASAVGGLVWSTIGSYFRGQLLVALIDAVGIALGLVVLRVPLALPVGVLVFFASLFPVVGALLSGFVAVIIALATKDFVTALIVLVVVLAVQQIEGNVLQPMILGRATSLHPLAVIAALIAGGSVLGILGAFLAVPVVASGWRSISYLRSRTPG